MKKQTLFSGQFSMFDFDVAMPVNKTEEKKTAKKAPKKAPVRKKKEKVSAIEKFYKDFNGIIIDDSSNEASVNAKNSDSFQTFCRKLKSALKKEAKERGFDDVTLKPNHYDMSGFFKKDGCFVYWRFSVERYGEPTSLDGKDCISGFLYRTAKSDKDFKGGNNHFTNLLGLLDGAEKLIEREKATKDKSFGFEKAIDTEKINSLTGDELKKVASILGIDADTGSAA